MVRAAVRWPSRAARSSFGALVGWLFLALAPLSGQEVCDAPWRLEETLRLGSADGDVTFSHVKDLAIGPDGRIYVLQIGEPVHVFLLDGRPAGTIGREGEGPGEFPSPPDELGWRGDTLWVGHRLGVQFLLADGTETRRVSYRIPVPSEGSRLSPGTPLPDGSFLPSRAVTEDEHLFLKADRVALPRLSAAGEVFDTLAVVERHLADFTVEREMDRNWWGLMLEHPLGPWIGEAWLPVAVTPDGSAIVLTRSVREERGDASFDLLRIRFDGDTLLSRRVEYRPRPISRAEEALQREAFGASLAGDDLPESMRRLSRREAERRRRIGEDLIRFPEFHPPVRGIVAGDDGSMWLLREAWPSAADVWEVYGADGRLEGTVRIEGPDHADWMPRLRILRANRTEIWGVTTGEFDVPYVHRYRIDRTCE